MKNRDKLRLTRKQKIERAAAEKQATVKPPKSTAQVAPTEPTQPAG